MVKNHDSNLNLENFLSQEKINSVLYSEPFVKVAFIDKLVQDTKIPVLYLDFDLLYTGYLTAEVLPRQDHVTVFQPTQETWKKTLTQVLNQLSTTRSLVIVDSLNGLFNIQSEKKEVGRLVLAYTMLLVSVAKTTGSYVVIASMARYKKEKGWTLSPPGKRMIELYKAQKIQLEKTDDGISMNFLDDAGMKKISLTNAIHYSKFLERNNN
ncbi:MAG: hypothetical protein ACE5JT_02970 [Nitrosopumilaceae archaeon]